jgi:hypothetical protein
LTGLDKYWNIVVEQIKKRVAADGSAGIASVISNCKVEGIIPNATNFYREDIEVILGKLLQSGEYLINTSDNDDHIKINPAYILNQNIIATNTSVQTTNSSIVELNKTLKTTNILALTIAAITGIFIAYSACKNDNKDLQLLNIKLNRQEQILDSMLKSQMGTDSSIRKAIKDSLYLKHK